VAAITFTAILWFATITQAQACPDTAIARIRDLNIRAAAEYLKYDYDVAKALLKSAVALAVSKNCGKNRQAARTFVLLGVVEYAGFKNRRTARAAWRRALAIWPGSTVPSKLASPALIRFFQEVKKKRSPASPSTARPPNLFGTDTQANVSDDVLNALKGRMVALEKKDESKVVGKLLAVNPDNVVIELSDRTVAVVKRAEIAQVKTAPASSPSVRRPGTPGSASHGLPPRRLTLREYTVRKRSADKLWKIGMGLTIGGLSLVVVGGILHGVAVRKISSGAGLAALTFYIIGPIMAAAGIPVWAVGGVRRSNLQRVKPTASLWDPQPQRAQSRRLGLLPPTTDLFSWRLSF
jgi:hypothetical protein